jgi:hypothetical protein
MPILLIVHRCCSTVTVALVSSVGESLGVMNRYVIGHDGAVVFEPMELLLLLLSVMMDSESCYHEGGGCDFAFKVLYVLIPT